MRKSVLLISLFFLTTVSLLAQGRIAFANTSLVRLRISDGGAMNQILGTASTAYFGIGPASVRIQLFAGYTSASLSPVLLGTGGDQSFVLNTSSGLAAAQGTFNGGNPLPLPGFDGSTPAFLQMTATSINGIYKFVSPIIQVTPGPLVATPVFGVGPNLWSDLTLFPIYPTPVIGTQPQSQSVVIGSPVTISVTAFAISGLTYQWRKNGSALAGQTNASLSFVGVSVTDAGNYDVVITNINGTTFSSIAVLQVLPVNAPSITVNGQLVAGTISVGGTATVAIGGGFPGGFIFYSLDGSMPSTSSALYDGPFALTTNTTVRAMSLSSDFSQHSEAPPVEVVVLPMFALTTAVSGSGIINLSPPSGPYPSNSVISLAAVAATNWVFDHWAGDLSGSVNPTNLTMIGPRTVQAVFAPTSYPLTVTTSGGGTVAANGQVIGANTYFPTGTVVSLQATPNSGWDFLRWQGTASGTANPFNVTMTQTQNVEAIFGTVVSSNIAGNGSITLSPTNPVPFGSLVTATATPASGYNFVTWSGAVTGTSNPTNFTVTTATPTVGALFAASPAPVIVRQPTNISVVLGNGAAFNVDASGAAPLSYQWRKGGTNINGATGTSHAIASTSTNDAGNYDVVVINGLGSSITSAVATLTILFPPAISQAPLSRFAIIGSNTTFSVTATGTPTLSYQWRKNGLNIGGAVATNYTLTGVTTNDAGGYGVVVSNPYGSITSTVAQLTVVFPPAIIGQPTNKIVPTGNLASFSVAASGTEPLSYQWRHSGTTITDATNSSFLLNPALTNHAGNYSVIVSNPYGQLTSAVATLTVFVPANISSGPFSQVVAAHDTAVFSVNAFGFPALSYQWRFDGMDVPGASSSSLVITNVGTNNLGNYWVEVWNAYSSATSTPAALLMSPSLYAPFMGLVSVWGKEAKLSVSAWGSGDLSYQWYKNGQPVAGATNHTLVFPSVQIGDGGLYSVVVSSPYGSVTNTPYQLVINPANVSLGFYAGITIEGVPGYTYGIEYTTDLANTNSWQNITNITLTQPVELWVDTSVESHGPGNNGRYYRVTNQ